MSAETQTLLDVGYAPLLANLSKQSSKVEGTLERSNSPEWVEEAGDPLSVWMSEGEEQGGVSKGGVEWVMYM